MMKRSKISALLERLAIARRILLKDRPYLLVRIKYPEMLRPNPPDYAYGKLLQQFEAQMESLVSNLGRLEPHLYCDQLETLSETESDPAQPYWGNTFFSGDDARVAYATTAVYRPANIIEVGSGNSTRFFRKAIRDHELSCSLLSIDPYPRSEVEGLADRIIRENVVGTDPCMFESLNANDVLFIDGSHLTFNGTDVPFLFLEVLPRIKPGVLVHVHDICLPYEYNEAYTRSNCNEQYLLACLLLFGDTWETLLPVNFLHKRGLLREGGSSFWMRRR
jgi:hypothetical protein